MGKLPSRVRAHTSRDVDILQRVRRESRPDPLPDLDFMPESAYANLYVFPQEADYVEQRQLGETWHRIDSSVRSTDDPFELPQELAERPTGSRLVYLSLGSLGSADVDLMKRLVDVLSRTPHRYIVSKGPQHAEYELADNMWGREFLPQTSSCR